MENYDTDHFNVEHLEFRVVTIHICALINPQNQGDDDGNPPTNHWAIYLQHSGGGCVNVDMSPGYGSDNLRGKIELASEAGAYTADAIKTLSFPVKPDVTVRSILQTINADGRDKYRFTKEWEGCRYWAYKLICDLEAADIIQEGGGESALEALSCYWRNPSGHELRIIREGNFYQ